MLNGQLELASLKMALSLATISEKPALTDGWTSDVEKCNDSSSAVLV